MSSSKFIVSLKSLKKHSFRFELAAIIRMGFCIIISIRYNPKIWRSASPGFSY
ncbi:hypothetical protein CLOSTMETH_01974 [[Clostridium] methylpentosum DSM 5476]|uniref:Uncharacterized protein n=1 Tax=[Clostridium] methylpentosum DSM 5476 TaxID=537013 RepID=C0EDP6_9FIRM|nr:hypothetical protein CLOSTMETH_01974 [[Clostridium] methylpentosum DSM 5476]